MDLSGTFKSSCIGSLCSVFHRTSPKKGSLKHTHINTQSQRFNICRDVINLTLSMYRLKNSSLHTHTHTHQYYSTMRKKEILPFVKKKKKNTSLVNLIVLPCKTINSRARIRTRIRARIRTQVS